jgi:hypothetical protein
MGALILAVENVALLAAGWYGRDVVEYTLNHTREHRRQKWHEREGRMDKRLHDWIVSYYEGHGQGEFLVRTADGSHIPYLSRPEWRVPLLDPKGLNFDLRPEVSAVPIDDRIVRGFQRAGLKIWDGEVYCLGSAIEQQHGSWKIPLMRGTYFQYLSRGHGLRREACDCIESKRKKPTRRDETAATMSQVESGLPGAQLVGFTVAVLMETREGPRVLLQNRSKETGVAGGSRAVVPAYVCEPQDTIQGAADFPRGDFFREFMEELYSAEFGKREATLRPDWFYDTRPIPELLQLERAGDFTFEVTGFGFDAITAELNVAAVAYINDPAFAEHEFRRMRLSWESDSIEIQPGDVQSLGEIISSERLYGTSAFTLRCLQQWMQERRKG